MTQPTPSSPQADSIARTAAGITNPAQRSAYMEAAFAAAGEPLDEQRRRLPDTAPLTWGLSREDAAALVAEERPLSDELAPRWELVGRMTHEQAWADSQSSDTRRREALKAALRARGGLSAETEAEAERASAPSMGHDGYGATHEARCPHGLLPDEDCATCSAEAELEHEHDTRDHFCPNCDARMNGSRCYSCGLEELA